MLFNSIDEVVQKYADSKINLLLLVAEKSDFEHSKIFRMDCDVCGAIFPQVIYKEQNYDDKIVVLELKDKTRFFLTSFKDFSKHKIKTDVKDLVVFVDGLSSNINDFLEKLYEATPLQTNIIGAGAGKMTLQQDKVLFSKNSIIQDGALILMGNWSFSISAKHGWQELAGPFIANDVEKNVLHSLDYKNAFELYKGIVEDDSKMVFNNLNFFNIAKSYPLGIAKLDGEILVRDPIAVNANSLILVGDMDKNSVVYILKGKKDSLVSSAEKASKEAVLGKREIDGVFIVDCISRVLFLEDEFTKELKIINESVSVKSGKLFGVLSLGEIANTNRDYIDFYNKTCVIGVY